MPPVVLSLLLCLPRAWGEWWTGELPEPPAAVRDSRPVSAPNVVLLMFDGVRWQEFLGNRPDPELARGDAAEVFPYFWSVLAGQGVVYGDLGLGSLMTVANPFMVSLPAYQSIMAGSVQPCRNNDCGRIRAETFPERLRLELKLPRAEVATFASWVKIPLAVESSEGLTCTDAGAGGHTRPDRETFPLALEHLKAKGPRFLFISLNDSDERADAGDYQGYLSALRQYDAWMKELFETLDGLGEYGRQTTVLVTTDHGRGYGQDWSNHDILRPWAGRIWLYARGPRASPLGRLGKGPVRSHADIRPTVEALLGLAPKACLLCGKPLPEVVGAAAPGS